MAPISLNQALVDSMANLAVPVVAIAGIAAHIFWFRRGEHHMYGVAYVQTLLIACVAGTLVLSFTATLSVLAAAGQVATLAASFLTGTYGSLLIYRLFFNPLNKFPGAPGTRISNFALSIQLKNGDLYNKLSELHQQHGHFVRIGSNDISITHPEAIPVFQGPNSKCRKAAWYDQPLPMVSMQTTRSRAEHDQRRRIWSSAFSDKALRGYEQRIRPYRDSFFSQISSFSGQPMNATKWFNLYSYDIMGDLAFNRSFTMLERSEQHWAIQLFHDGVQGMTFHFPVWFFRMVGSVPALMRDWFRFRDYCKSCVHDRMQTKVSTPDIMSSLLAPHEGKTITSQELNMLHGDSQLIIVAGSDTTATSLTFAFLELIRNPQHISILREEIAPYMKSNGTVLNADIVHLEHLNAVIHETLRLHPAVPSALQRITPPEGVMVGDTFVAGNAVVICPQYVMARCEDIYAHAKEFVPERWTTKPEMVKAKSAYAPFSIGPYGCIGKPLAMMNIRTTLAEMLHRFDPSFAPGEDGTTVETKSKEHFTLGTEELGLCFTKR